jgi:chemosensory pili system protein ChpC
MRAKPAEIRGVLIAISGGRLLLPNATVSEVITLSTPEPVEHTPDWLLGRVGWRGWRLPLVAFSPLAGLPEREGALNSRVTVLKVFGGNPHMPFIALVTQGFPRLTTITEDGLAAADDDAPLPPGVQAYVRIGDNDAIIPDLAYIERTITRALEDAGEG